ncbi:MAG: tandem-95 repeat protein [Calditrichae bacterium]|nr:tandem-95 repeat protein [Calditrichia bacterium]
MGKYVTFLFCIMSFQSVFAQTKVVIPAAKDNTIYEYYDTDQQYFRSNGIGDYFFAGVNGAEGGSRIVRGLIQFDLQKYIPDGVEVLDVTLNLNMNQTNSGPQAVSIYPLLQDWGEGASDAPIGEGLGAQAQSGDATWLHTFYNPRIPDDPNTLWTEKGGDFNQTASASVIVDQPAVYSWSSTESMINDVQTWAKDPASNFGWIIRGDESGQLTAKRFISRSNPDGNGPELIVTYDYPNSSPVAVNDTTETTEDQSVQISVSKNDYDTDGTIDISSIAVSKNPVHGKTEINNEIVTYTPESDYYGTDSFEYTIKDNDGATSNSAMVIITIAPVNDAPVTADIPNQTINEGSSFTTINLDTYVSDVDNADSEMTWTYSGNTSLGVSIVNRVATITTPNADWNGAETITFTATDPGNLSDSDAATFTVNAINDAPVIADIPNQTINEGSSFTTINLDTYVSDVDNADSEMTWTYSGNTSLGVSIVNRVATILTGTLKQLTLASISQTVNANIRNHLIELMKERQRQFHLS